MSYLEVPYQILLVEDCAADAFLVRLALEQLPLPHRLTVVNDGTLALALLDHIDGNEQEAVPDLLLLDMHLPKLGGADILRHLRATERCARMPVVVMTSSDADEDHATAEKHAALYYFRKPSTLDEFLRLGDIVSDLLTGSKAPAERFAERGSAA
jgi:CheY-like chemotaxis protein